METPGRPATTPCPDTGPPLRPPLRAPEDGIRPPNRWIRDQEKEQQAFRVGMTDMGSRQDAHTYEVLAAEIAEAIAEA